MDTIDYSTYSLEDLLDSKLNIDKDANPENYQALLDEIKSRGEKAQSHINEQEKNNLQGLGGWLILLGIGVVISPFRLAYAFIPLYYSIFTEGAWNILTTAGNNTYHPL